MKKIIFLFLIVHCTLLIENCMCQWQWLNPYPTANTIYCIRFVNTQTGYAACEAGTVLKTTNGGTNWRVIMLNNSSNLYAVHFINANTGMIGGVYGLAFRTTNGGNTWKRITINDSVTFSDIRFRNASTGIMVTSYYRGGYYDYFPNICKTTNGGLNWSVKKYGTKRSWLYSIAYASNSKIFAAGENYLLMSTDTGETWDSVYTNGFDSMKNVSVWFINSNTGYVMSYAYSGGYYYYLSKTTDGGATWNKYNTGAYGQLNSMAFINANTGIAVGIYSGLYRTTNGGVNWDKFPNATDSMRYYYSVTNAGVNRFIYAGDGGIIFRSMNAGANFSRISKSFTDETINSVCFLNSQMGVVCGNNGAIFKTNNGGVSWTQQSCPGAGNFLKVKLFDLNTGYAVAANGRVYKTINGGNTWNTIFSDNNANGWGICDIPDIQNIYIAGGHCEHGGAKTTNGGITWDTLYFECNCHPPIPMGCMGREFIAMASANVCFVSGQYSPPHAESVPFANFYFGGYEHIFYYDGFGDNNIITFADYVDTNYAIATGTRGRVMKTHDGFRTHSDYWYPVGNNSAVRFLSLADTLNSIANIYNIIPGLSGFYKSTNGGMNWALCGIVNNVSLNALKYYNFNYAVSYGRYGSLVANQNPGIITYSIPVTSTVPAGFKLFQNYPNPFNPTTIIKYSIARLSSPHAQELSSPNAQELSSPNAHIGDLVLLKVYDILGKEVATLVNEKQNAGTYEVKFDGSKLSSGIYFYTLTAGKFEETKKLILLK